MEHLLEQKISRIVQLEYRQFDAVHGQDGRASCQDDFKTFRIMRESQFRVWDEATLAQYEQDLVAAEQAGVNLVTEKYGYMMKETDPDAFLAISDQLRPIDPDKLVMIEPILEIHRRWYLDLVRTYPKLVGNGRTITQDEARHPGETSVLTYLRGELLTYSLPTLRCYKQMVQRYVDSGQNMVREILWQTAQHYGYASLEAAERSIR
jgi:hypothetical protein